jgi:hypothetical protein
VIQQTIMCDICGTQKRQANHWFVARNESGELRISGWNPSRLASAGAKHLCGETCSLKFVSHFLMRLMGVEMQRPAANSEDGPTAESP